MWRIDEPWLVIRLHAEYPGKLAVRLVNLEPIKELKMAMETILSGLSVSMSVFKKSPNMLVLPVGNTKLKTVGEALLFFVEI